MPRDGLLATLPRFYPLAAAPRESRAMLAYDPTLAWAALLLLAIGLVMVYSASIATAEASAYTGYRPWYFLARHALFVAAGLTAGLIAFQVPVKAWRTLAPYLFVAGAALLIAVLVPGVGRAINGSKRWLPGIGPRFSRIATMRGRRPSISRGSGYRLKRSSMRVPRSIPGSSPRER